MTDRALSSICVFCGSRTGADPAFLAAAVEFGRAIAERGITLVYGGAKVGLMGAVADAALAARGRVIGVIPRSLVSKEIVHDDLTELFLTETLAARKERMIELSDAFAALPGGFGTYDELFETLTLAQIGIQDKPTGLLDTSGFFGPFVSLIRHTIEQAFASPQHAELLVVEREPVRLIDALASWRAPSLAPKWDAAPGTRAPR